MKTRNKLDKGLNRRGFLGGVLKLGAGAAALSVVGCEGFDTYVDGRDGKRGRCGGGLEPSESASRTATPEELFTPISMAMMLGEKWRLDNIVRKPDTHLRVTLTDIQTGNPLELEVFRGPDTEKRAIAQTDRWEFYTYDGKTAGQTTPEHVVDAINQLALNLVGHENDAPFVKLNRTVCLFADRDPGPPEQAGTGA